MIFDELIARLQVILSTQTRRSKKLLQKVDELIEECASLYQEISNLSLSEYENKLPAKELLKTILHDNYVNLKNLKKSDSFIKLLRWIEIVLESFKFTLEKNQTLEEEYKKIIMRFNEKSDIMLSQMEKPDIDVSDTDEDDSDLSEGYEILPIPRMSEDLVPVFSHYGTVKWLLIDNKNDLTKENQEGLEKAGWKKLLDGLYQSPTLFCVEDHSEKIKELILTLFKNTNIDRTYDNIEVVASFGAFYGNSLCKQLK